MASRPRPGKPSPRHLAPGQDWLLGPCPLYPCAEHRTTPPHPTPSHPKVLTGLRTRASPWSHLVPSIRPPAAPAPPPSAHLVRALRGRPAAEAAGLDLHGPQHQEASARLLPRRQQVPSQDAPPPLFTTYVFCCYMMFIPSLSVVSRWDCWGADNLTYLL